MMRPRGPLLTEEAGVAAIKGIIWAAYYVRDITELEARVTDLELRLAECLVE